MKQTGTAAKPSLKSLIEKWPSAFIARQEIGKFTGGLVNSKTLANLDSAGLGPQRVRLGRKIGYPIEPFVEWMEGRATACPDRKQSCTCGGNCACKK